MIYKQKNHLFTINFFSKNLHYLDDCQFVIVGDGELVDFYKKKINENNLSDKIKITNFKKIFIVILIMQNVLFQTHCGKILDL